MRALIILLACACFAGSLAQAGEAQPLAQDPVLEARLQSLSKELRCLVCQNETLADSHASLAEDLRVEVRELLRQGKDDQQVKAYLVARYGDFVLYRPKVDATTWLLWFGPVLLLIAGLFGLFQFLRSRAQGAAPSQLNAADKARAEALLREGESQ